MSPLLEGAELEALKAQLQATQPVAQPTDSLDDEIEAGEKQLAALIAAKAAKAKALPFFQSIALPLAARGLKVIPIKGKIAFLDEHQKEATSDPEKITVTWASHGDCNVGIHCIQEPGGNLIVDCDDFNPVAEYKRETGKDAPVTYTVQSSPGSIHQYFNQTDRTLALSGNITEANTGGKFSIRLNNYYGAGEGSIHPIHGRPYIALVSAPIVDIPGDYLDWLLSKVEKSKPVDASLTGEKIPYGQHDTELTRIAGKLRNAGCETETIKEHLIGICESRCENHGDDYKEMCEKIANSVGKYPVGTNYTAFIGPSNGTAGQSQVQADEILPLISVDGDSFMTEQIPPRKVLLRLKDKKNPIFFEQSINQIFAWRGLGKTCLGFGLTGALAKGGSILNWEAPERCRVLYVEGELPASQAQARWKQIIGETNGYARLITIDKQPGNTIPSLATATGMARIEKTLAQLESEGFKTDVLILDSISTLFNIGANDEDPWLTIQSWLISLRSRGLCIFFFHHAGKSGLSRSHSKSEDMLDVSIKLDFPKEPDLDCLHVLVHYDKARAGFSDPDTEVKMRRVHSQNCPCQTPGVHVGCPGDRVSWEFRAPGDQKRFEAEQRFRAGRSDAQIAEELDIIPSTVRSWRNRWKKAQGKKGAGFDLAVTNPADSSIN